MDNPYEAPEQEDDIPYAETVENEHWLLKKRHTDRQAVIFLAVATLAALSARELYYAVTNLLR